MSRVLASWRGQAGLCGPWPVRADGAPRTGRTWACSDTTGRLRAGAQHPRPRSSRCPASVACPVPCAWAPLRDLVPGPSAVSRGALAGARPGWPDLVALTQQEGQLVWDPWEPEERVGHRPNSRRSGHMGTAGLGG